MSTPETSRPKQRCGFCGVLILVGDDRLMRDWEHPDLLHTCPIPDSNDERRPTPIRARARDSAHAARMKFGILTPPKMETCRKCGGAVFWDIVNDEAREWNRPQSLHVCILSPAAPRHERLRFTLPPVAAEGVDPITAAERDEHDRHVEWLSCPKLSELPVDDRLPTDDFVWLEVARRAPVPDWLTARPVVFALGTAAGALFVLLMRGWAL